MAQAATLNNHGTAATALAVTIYSDVICPWCYVGKRRFEAALIAPGMPKNLAISWRPFELNPDMPVEGMERSAYRARKFGADKSRELDRELAETGRELGIAFAFDKMARTRTDFLLIAAFDYCRDFGFCFPQDIVNALQERWDAEHLRN